jgi:glycosyltransferase domain-containing protein
MLTALMPTRNRPQECARQLRYLQSSGFPHRIVVLDGGDEEHAQKVQAACAGFAEYRRFGPSFRMADKLAAAIDDVATPFVILTPDDDVILRHAIEAELTFLQNNPDFIAAHGYFLSFAMHLKDVDIHRVIGFTPSIVDENPLRRHYDLFRRYQSFYWGVFRTEVFAAAVKAATAMRIVLFREITVMSTAILMGKVARLPLIHALRGAAKSHAPLEHSDPLRWLLNDAESFFGDYLIYRNALAGFLSRRGVEAPQGARLEQILDMSHATWLARSIDNGQINYTAQRLLGEPFPPIPVAPDWAGWSEPSEQDEIHRSCKRDRRYVWRRDVLSAEPREEIAIDHDEMARVEAQLDAYG